jgi:hypothetical protein
MERSSRALVAALGPLTVGHLLAMLVVILPFSLLVALVQWQRQIQIGASLLVIGFGSFRLINRSHPRVLAIGPRVAIRQGPDCTLKPTTADRKTTTVGDCRFDSGERVTLASIQLALRRLARA